MPKNITQKKVRKSEKSKEDSTHSLLKLPIGSRIKTNRGYEGTLLNVFFSGDVAVVLDGCTYSDEHWYDLIPTPDIVGVSETSLEKKVDDVLSEIRKLTIQKMWSNRYIFCLVCGLYYPSDTTHICFPRYPVPNYTI